MAAADMVLKLSADTTEFEIAMCRVRFELANSEAIFWERKLADAIAKRR